MRKAHHAVHRFASTDAAYLTFYGVSRRPLLVRSRLSGHVLSSVGRSRRPQELR